MGNARAVFLPLVLEANDGATWPQYRAYRELWLKATP
jgi:hypothetical protein